MVSVWKKWCHGTQEERRWHHADVVMSQMGSVREKEVLIMTPTWLTNVSICMVLSFEEVEDSEHKTAQSFPGLLEKKVAVILIPRVWFIPFHPYSLCSCSLHLVKSLQTHRCGFISLKRPSSLYHEDMHSPGRFPVYGLVRWHTVRSLDE